MLQLENTTPFPTSMFHFPDPNGVDTLYAVLKATFVLTPRGIEIAESDAQYPIVAADEYQGDPATTSIKTVGEAHLAKPGTNVLVIGEACTSGGKLQPFLDVGVSVAGRSQMARVFGDRVWQGGLFAPKPSKPQPFSRLPLTYERAFGGWYTAPDGKVWSEPKRRTDRV